MFVIMVLFDLFLILVLVVTRVATVANEKANDYGSNDHIAIEDLLLQRRKTTSVNGGGHGEMASKNEDRNLYLSWPRHTSSSTKRTHNHTTRSGNNNIGGGTTTTQKRLYGFDYAFQTIWKWQYEQDCRNAKFLIASGWNGGFGALIHAQGYLLAVALNQHRILLEHPLSCRYQTQNHFCDKEFCRGPGGNYIENMECYYEPWSSCTLDDAIPGWSKNFSMLDDIPEIDESKRNEDRRRVLKAPLKFYTNEYPHRFERLMKTAPWYSYFSNKKETTAAWWLSVSTAFFIRPNNRTLLKLEELMKSDFVPSSPCIGIYVRHGDKFKEMKLQPFTKYSAAASYLLRSKYMARKITEYSVFIGTENPDVLKEAIEWGVATGLKVHYTNLFDRSTQQASKPDWDNSSHYNETEIGHHELEYHSMLLNLQLMLQCDAWICTSKSGWCRVIDQLRSTVMSKAHLPSLDLSDEECSKDFRFCFDSNGASGVLRAAPHKGQ